MDRIKINNSQWYEKSPKLFQEEVRLMLTRYPQFKLGKLENGNIYWYGHINSFSLGDLRYTLMIVYAANHPLGQMGSSVRVYMIDPNPIDSSPILSVLRPNETPYKLCSQLLSDIGGFYYQATWVDEKFPQPHSAVRELNLYLAYLFIRECAINSHIIPLKWEILKKVYPSLEAKVNKLIYEEI